MQVRRLYTIVTNVHSKIGLASFPVASGLFPVARDSSAEPAYVARSVSSSLIAPSHKQIWQKSYSLAWPLCVLISQVNNPPVINLHAKDLFTFLKHGARHWGITCNRLFLFVIPFFHRPLLLWPVDRVHYFLTRFLPFIFQEKPRLNYCDRIPSNSYGETNDQSRHSSYARSNPTGRNCTEVSLPTVEKEPRRTNAYAAEKYHSDQSINQPTTPVDSFLLLSPAPIQRSQSDVSRFKRRLSSSTTVPNDLSMKARHQEPQIKTVEWTEESTEIHYSPDENSAPERNVMQRMRKGLTNLRSGVLARLQRTPQYVARKSSYECDMVEEPEMPDHWWVYPRSNAWLID